jgi:hypothetical protein
VKNISRNKARDWDIAIRVLRYGQTMSDAASMHGLSTSRVRQIVFRFCLGHGFEYRGWLPPLRTLRDYADEFIGAAAACGPRGGSVEFTPSEATYMLQRGERVLSPRQMEEVR